MVAEQLNKWKNSIEAGIIPIAINTRSLCDIYEPSKNT